MFILGIVILTYPAATDDNLSVLPQTGSNQIIEVTQKIDKEHIQMDDPSADAQKASITIKVSNKASCNISPVDAIIAVDSSAAAMNLKDELKSSIGEFLPILPEGSTAGLSTFGGDAAVIKSLTDDFGTLINDISKISYGGNANLAEGISLGYKELVSNRKNEDNLPVLLLILGSEPSDIANAIDIADFAKAQSIQVILINLNADNAGNVKSIASDDSYYPANINNVDEVMNTLALMFSKVAPELIISQNITDIKQKAVIEDAFPKADIIDENFLHWKIGSLQCGESALVQTRININDFQTDLTEIDSIVTVTNPLIQSGDVESSEDIVLHSPNLEITKTDNRDITNPGTVSNYVINVKNTGSGNAYNVKINDDIDANYLNVMTETISNAEVTDKGLMWDNNGEGYKIYGTYEKGSSIEDSQLNIQFSAKLAENIDPKIREFGNTAVAVTAKGTIFSGFDKSSIGSKSDLEVVKTSREKLESVKPGSNLTYTLTVANLGNSTATNVVLEELIPSDAIDRVDTVDGIKVSGNKGIIWKLGNLDVNQTISKTYSVHIKDNYTNPEIIFTTKVSSDDPEVNMLDNLIERKVKVDSPNSGATEITTKFVKTEPVYNTQVSSKKGEVAGASISNNISFKDKILPYIRILIGLVLTLPLPILLLFKKENESVK